MRNFRSFAMIAITTACLMACGSGEQTDKVGELPSDSTEADSTNVDSMATGTAGGMPRDIPNGTGTDSIKPDSTKKGKWPTQGNPIQ